MERYLEYRFRLERGDSADFIELPPAIHLAVPRQADDNTCALHSLRNCLKVLEIAEEQLAKGPSTVQISLQLTPSYYLTSIDDVRGHVQDVLNQIAARGKLRLTY